MNKEDFLYAMYKEYGIVPNLVKRYIPDDLEDYSSIDRESLAIEIQSKN